MTEASLNTVVRLDESLLNLVNGVRLLRKVSCCTIDLSELDEIV